METMLFVLQVVLLSCALGIAIDLVTANVAVEYFTVHHPHVVDSDSPWVMAFIWGIGASWWFGFAAAALLWWVNSRRAFPLQRARVVRMVGRAMVLLWLLMMAIVVCAYLFTGMIPAADRRPTFESDRRLIAVAMAHAAEYVLGGLLTVIVMVRIASMKQQPAGRKKAIQSQNEESNTEPVELVTEPEGN